MPFWAGSVAMEPAGAAVQGLLDLDDESLVREGAEAESGDGGAIDGGDRGVYGGCEMHGSRIVDIVHGCAFHQGGGLQEAKRPAEIDGAGMGGFYLFAAFFIGWGAEEIDGISMRQLSQEGGPFFGRILFGEPDGGRGDGDIGLDFVRLDFFLIAWRRIKAGFGRLIVGEGCNKSLIAFDLVAVANDVGDLFAEKEAKRVFVKSDCLPRAGEGGEQAGCGEPLDVDNDVIFYMSDGGGE